MRQQNQKDVCQLSVSGSDQKIPLFYQGAQVASAVHYPQDKREDNHQKVYQDTKIYKKISAWEATAEDQGKSREVSIDHKCLPQDEETKIRVPSNQDQGYNCASQYSLLPDYGSILQVKKLQRSRSLYLRVRLEEDPRSKGSPHPKNMERLRNP